MDIFERGGQREDREKGSLSLRQYKFGFEINGLVLFLVIMVPNFIWFFVPAPNDILRGIRLRKRSTA